MMELCTSLKKQKPSSLEVQRSRQALVFAALWCLHRQWRTHIPFSPTLNPETYVFSSSAVITGHLIILYAKSIGSQQHRRWWSTAGRERRENVFTEEGGEEKGGGRSLLPLLNFNLLNSTEHYFMVVLWSPGDPLM